jgi:O-antigen biosynthesis protein
MNTKKIVRKLKIAKNLLHDQGVLSVGIRSLEFIQKKTRKNKSRKNKVDTSAIYSEVLAADPSLPANKSWLSPKKTKQSLTINWLMPPPGKGSGGHMTIYRFIEYLEKAGHTCRIYFHNPGPGSSVEAVQAIMGTSFPPVKASTQWLEVGEEMSKADAVFATSWQTAYTVYSSKLKAKKFYFVQDFEPFFYPVGGMSILAENTYKLGLRGITAGGWLEKKLHEDYGMTTSSFDFGSDSTLYQHINDHERKEIAFYARPTTARRAFELGIMTLDIFHKMHPEYTINFIGWDISEYSIPFPHKNLGILDPEELNELYNKSAASLVMSLTNMSLLPLELLSSGCIPVVNDGPNNRLVSNNPYIAYSKDSDPTSLAKALSKVIETKNLTSYAKKASASVNNNNWDESGEKFVKMVVDSYHSDGLK